MARFLAVLHRVDTRAFPAMPGPDEVWRGWHDLRRASEPVLNKRLTRSENQRLRRWWDRFLDDGRVRSYQPVVRHGDLWYGNLLVQPRGTISAVLDWESVAIADPAQDLAVARYLGESFASIMLDAYQNCGGSFNREILYRIDRHWELRELTGIPLAVAVEDEDEVSDCVSKLRAGPILS